MATATEIYVELADDASTELRAPAIDLLLKLQQVSPVLYLDAIKYLCGPTFRWVFVSDMQPHRFLLRAFHAQVPLEIRERITHVELRGITTQGFIHPSVSPGWEPLERRWFNKFTAVEAVALSPYFKRMSLGDKPDNNDIRRGIKRDIGMGMTLLSFTLPCLKWLGLSLDIVDCLDEERVADTLSSVREIYWEQKTVGSILPIFDSLRTIKHLGNIDLHIFWDDFFRQGRKFNSTLTEETEQGLQAEFIGALRKRIHAKSITSHPKA